LREGGGWKHVSHAADDAFSLFSSKLRLLRLGLHGMRTTLGATGIETRRDFIRLSLPPEPEEPNFAPPADAADENVSRPKALFTEIDVERPYRSRSWTSSQLVERSQGRFVLSHIGNAPWTLWGN